MANQEAIAAVVATHGLPRVRAITPRIWSPFWRRGSMISGPCPAMSSSQSDLSNRRHYHREGNLRLRTFAADLSDGGQLCPGRTVRGDRPTNSAGGANRASTRTGRTPSISYRQTRSVRSWRSETQNKSG
jgi:hypothetical protein